MSTVIIPLKGIPETFSISINGQLYFFTIRWADTEDFGWWMDIMDSERQPLVCGIPLTTGNDLLYQYRYKFGFSLYLQSELTDLPPGLYGLGQDIKLVAEI